MRLLRGLARAGRLSPLPGWDDERLADALSALGDPVSDRALTALAATVVLAGCLVTPAAAVLAPPGAGLVVVGSLWAATGAGAGAVLLWPRLRARAHRARALGDAPDVVGLAVLRLRVAPAPELAARFAAAHAEGPLAAALAEHVRRAAGNPDAGWQGLVAAWGDEVPALGRGVSLLTAASEADPADRDRLLDRALAAVLDGTRERMARFATALQGPTTLLYAFGVVLPLAVVGALPTARAAGIQLGLPAVVLVYDVLLPLGLLVAGATLVAGRPTAFPAPRVGPEHPAVPPRARRLLLAVLGAAAAGYVLARLAVPGWGVPVVVPGLVAGAALVVWSHPLVAVRRRTRALEADVPDALTVVGQHLRRGRAPETALAAAGDRVTGPAGDRFAAAARLCRRLGVGPEAALLGDRGALADDPSPRLRAAAVLLVRAAREGPAGGTVLVSLADHLDDLVAVERTARRELSTVIGTLRSTGRWFAPLVGGTTVALAGRIDGAAIARGAGTLPLDGLATAVGGYVLLTAAVLGALTGGLEAGPDPAVLAHEAGLALTAAAVVYPLTVAATGVVV